MTPALIRLRASLRNLLGQAGPADGAAVFDLPGQAPLVEIRASVKRPPASVEKLYTSVALLQKFSPGTRFHTMVLGTGHKGPGGVWHGNLYLRGDGDPTLGDGSFNRVWELGYGPTAQQLVAQVSARGIKRVTGHVIADQSLFDSNPGGPATAYAPDVPDYGGQLSALSYDHGSTSGGLSPGAFAVKELVLAMQGAGIQANASAATRHTPASAQALASVASPPLSVLLKLMDVPSDDLFADMFAKQLGARFEGRGSIGAGARVIRGIIASYGLHPSIVDGSGLSRADRSSPNEVIALLRAIWRTPLGAVLWHALPVVGVNGTVQTIADGTAAQNRCIAKTGTLDNVTNLAGYCHTRGGHIVAFALFVDGPQNSQALPIIGQMVAAIARY